MGGADRTKHRARARLILEVDLRSTLPLLLPLLGCAVQDFPAPDCELQHGVVSTLSFARIESGISQGFDLDDQNSGEDAASCGPADLVGPEGQPGIDNAFGGLLPVLEATEAAALEPLVQDFIARGTILLVFEMSGWNESPGESTCGSWRVLPGRGEPLLGTDGLILPGQTLDLEPGPHEAPVPAMVEDDVLMATGFGFDLEVQIFDAEVFLPVRGGRVELERQEDGSMQAIVGGGFLVDGILDSLLGTGIDDEVEALLESVMRSSADLDLDGDGSCEAMSVALEVEAVPVWIYSEADDSLARTASANMSRRSR